jgi:GR25 family glycosyltransferase involved in LPS biosynthesis
MDILIKSFNRPYYLDRCLQSIYLNCADSDFKIKILDDGTPQKYLNKLQEKFPDISILKSEFYDSKSKKCALGVKPETMKIPINLWIETAKNASDYFVLLEDDIWFTKKVNLNRIHENLKLDNLTILKLYWLGNPKFIKSKSSQKKDFFTVFEPDLYTKSLFLYSIAFHRFSRLKFREIFSILSIYSKERFLAYYSIYAVAGVIFKKDYFLMLWKNHKNSVDEGLQIANAVRYMNQNASAFGHSNNEVLKTGFLSSATNQFKENFETDIDMFQFNKTINEAWFADKLDVMDNYPKDISMDVISTILDSENNPLIDSNNWKKWVSCFRNQYEQLGCKID